MRLLTAIWGQTNENRWNGISNLKDLEGVIDFYAWYLDCKLQVNNSEVAVTVEATLW